MILEKFPDNASGIMQAFVPNLRRDKFKDPRVRLALNYAWDFESIKDVDLFRPVQAHQQLFRRHGARLVGAADRHGAGDPRDAFATRCRRRSSRRRTPIRSAARRRRARENLRKALQLLPEAGYELRGRQLVNAKTGEPFTIELLDNDPGIERYVLPYQQNLAKIGIELTLRIVDSSQHVDRLRNRDFDMTVVAWGQSLSPGNEQRRYLGQRSADQPNSQNYAGIKNPAIDKLIDRVIFAKDREELVAATKALDRVLLWNHYVIPQFDTDVSAWRAGTGSGIRTTFRLTRRAFPTSGGMMRRRRRDRREMNRFTRRTVLKFGAAAGRRVLLPSAWRAPREAARHVALRRSEISARTSRISTT